MIFGLFERIIKKPVFVSTRQLHAGSFFFACQITRSASRTQLRAKKLTRPCARSIEGNDPSSYALCGVHAFPRFRAADTLPALPPSDATRSRGIPLLFASVRSTRAARPPASTLAHHAAA